MKVLWVGDAIVSTGFSHCSHAVCDMLSARGHEVHVLGLNYFGDPHNKPYKVYPCYQPLAGGYDSMGQNRFPAMLDQIKPDIAILLNDPWNIEGYFKCIDQYNDSIDKFNENHKLEIGNPDRMTHLFPSYVLSWLAVDSMNMKAEACNLLSRAIVWTEFAKAELARGGCTRHIDIIPLGVDTSVFSPKDKLASRRKIRIPDAIDIESAYIVGCVGRNQYRKRLDLTIGYFAQWVHTYDIPNAYLYIHTSPTGDMGVDIKSLSRWHGISGRVILSEPSIGTGESESHMASVYSALDVLISTSQAEGFWLPGLESMACGTPTICSDWAGFDWTKGVAEQVPCSSLALTAPFGQQLYTIGGIPDRDLFVKALDRVYSDQDLRERMIIAGRSKAESMTWDRSAREFCYLIEKTVGIRSEMGQNMAENISKLFENEPKIAQKTVNFDLRISDLDPETVENLAILGAIHA